MYFSEWRKLQEEVSKKQFEKFLPNEAKKKKRKKMIDIDSEHYPMELT